MEVGWRRWDKCWEWAFAFDEDETRVGTRVLIGRKWRAIADLLEKVGGSKKEHSKKESTKESTHGAHSMEDSEPLVNSGRVNHAHAAAHIEQVIHVVITIHHTITGDKAPPILGY